MMRTITTQVWVALKRPPIHHPLFRHVSRHRVPTASQPPGRTQRIALAAFLLGVAAAVLRFYAEGILVLILVLPLVLMAIYVALYGTLRGLYWAFRVSNAIAREHERGVYDLLSLSPYGAFSASWAICTGCQYYDQTFNELGSQRVWFFRIFFVTLLFSGALAGFSEANLGGIELIQSLISISTISLMLTLAFHIDDIHSTVIGSLVGLIVPMFARHRLDARLGALFVFLLLQVAAYAGFWLVGFTVLPQINAQLMLTGFAAALVLPLEQLLVFFTIREVMAHALWRGYALLLHGEIGDLSMLTRGGRLIW